MTAIPAVSYPGAELEKPYTPGPGAEAYSTTAIINRCVHAADTQVLIDELKQRGRLRNVSIAHMYFSEMAVNGLYMEYIDRELIASVAKLVAGVLVLEDRPQSPSEEAMRVRTRIGSLSVLVPEKGIDTTESQG